MRIPNMDLESENWIVTKRTVDKVPHMEIWQKANVDGAADILQWSGPMWQVNELERMLVLMRKFNMHGPTAAFPAHELDKDGWPI